MNNIAFNIALPLLCAFVLPVIHAGSPLASRIMGPFVLLAMVWFAAFNLYVLQHPISLALGGFLPPQGISFHLDQLALIFALIIPLITLLLWPYRNSHGVREEGLLLLLAGAASGLALSADLFNIYVFYELISVASFGLAAANRSSGAFAASFRYVIISGLGTVLALTGIALIYTQTGTLNLAHIGLLSEQLNNPIGLSAFALIVLGIGVKAEVFPVNGWVPEVYATASVRVSSLLAGLVSKLAVLAMVRLLVVAYEQPGALMVLLVLGVLGILWGEFSAWRSQDMKRMLAFSSIGQLGLVLVAFSIPGQAGMMAGIAVMLHHLIIKPGLFLLTESWHGSITDIAGSARRSPLAAALFMLFALSLIGVPPLPGFWAKLLVVTGLAGMNASAYYTALFVLLAATVVEANYLMRVATRIFSSDGTGSSQPHSRLTLGVSSAFALVLLIALLALPPIGQKLDQLGAESSDRFLYIGTTFQNRKATMAGPGL